MMQMTNQEELWRALFKEERASLTIAATIISRRNSSADLILDTALEELQGQPFYKVFGLASALRTVVKTAIADNMMITDRDDILPPSAATDNEGDAELPWMKFLMNLPWVERVVYYLSEVLKYSRRDTALLMGMSDTNVDQLRGIAKRRVRLAAQDVFESATYKLSAV